jgi:hypothetical protein
MGFRIVDVDTDPAIRGCSYCDLERGGISDATARTFAAARRAFWRAHDELEKTRAKHDTAAVHALVDAAQRADRRGDADDCDDEIDDSGDHDDVVDAAAGTDAKRALGSHSPRRASSLPPRHRTGTGSASRRVRFRRA